MPHGLLGTNFQLWGSMPSVSETCFWTCLVKTQESNQANQSIQNQKAKQTTNQNEETKAQSKTETKTLNWLYIKNHIESSKDPFKGSKRRFLLQVQWLLDLKIRVKLTEEIFSEAMEAEGSLTEEWRKALEMLEVMQLAKGLVETAKGKKRWFVVVCKFIRFFLGNFRFSWSLWLRISRKSSEGRFFSKTAKGWVSSSISSWSRTSFFLAKTRYQLPRKSSARKAEATAEVGGESGSLYCGHAFLLQEWSQWGGGRFFKQKKCPYHLFL